jgi:hypothetical protein
MHHIRYFFAICEHGGRARPPAVKLFLENLVRDTATRSAR